MSQFYTRLDRITLSSFVVFLHILISTFPAFAGGFGDPYEGSEEFKSYPEDAVYPLPESLEKNKSKYTQSKNISTVLPRMIDVSGWHEESLKDGIICKSDLFNQICLTPEQSENLGW